MSGRLARVQRTLHGDRNDAHANGAARGGSAAAAAAPAINIKRRRSPIGSDDDDDGSDGEGGRAGLPVGVTPADVTRLGAEVGGRWLVVRAADAFVFFIRRPRACARGARAHSSTLPLSHLTCTIPARIPLRSTAGGPSTTPWSTASRPTRPSWCVLLCL
jgi:hypothetical protein